MNREEIIRMADEAKLTAVMEVFEEELERFAALVAASEAAKWAKGAKISVPTMTMEQEFTWHRNKGYEQGKALIPAAVAAEREACAKVCDEFEMRGHDQWERTSDPEAQGKYLAAADCATAIRKRGEK